MLYSFFFVLLVEEEAFGNMILELQRRGILTLKKGGSTEGTEKREKEYLVKCWRT
jgi:hypothetical protein